MTAFSFITALLAAPWMGGRVNAVNNGLALTPQMGWDNWNAFGCSINSTLLLSTASIILSLGLRDVGYNYVVLDDCWSAGRDENGLLQPDLEKFPGGIAKVADAVHGLGLRFGMYSSAGDMTCARFAGSLDHEVEDAQSFANWSVDYLKYDNCYHLGRFGTPKLSFDRFAAMSRALNATGRPILFSLCNWGEDYVHTWGMSIANSWRISGDIYDSFARPNILCSCHDPSNPHCIAPGTSCSVYSILNRVATFADRAQKGGWNDLDMLEVGNGGMTDDEYVAHFSMWAALKSPLLMGNNLRVLTPSAYSILNNPAVIAINQDPLGQSAYRVHSVITGPKDRFSIGEYQIWSGRLAHGDQVVIFVSFLDQDIEVSASLEDIFLHDGPGGSAWQVHKDWYIHDLWADRMDEVLAKAVLDAQSSDTPERARMLLNMMDWYNATEISYEEGLKQGDMRIIGRKIGSVKADGTITATVKRHGVRMFRLTRNKYEKRPKDLKGMKGEL